MLEPSPPNIWVDCLNPFGLKCDNRKGYIGGWIYLDYSVAWMIPVVGFDCLQCYITLRRHPEESPSNIGVDGSNLRGIKCDNGKGYIGGWIYLEYSVA